MNTNTIESGILVRHAPSGEVGRIGNRGARGVWLGDENGYGHYVYESDCTPLTGAELAAAEKRFGVK